ncbi:Histidine phosphatase superfamily [Theobroma cacao]|nr:Histidine phosphatase superfamily [Theobroma cacao]
MNASAAVGVGISPSTSKPLAMGLTPIPIRLRWRRSCSMIETEAELAASEAQPVSRRLILLRHAKSSWQHTALRDHDRPLSKTGRADAALVSKKLQHMGWIPQLILSSDALRTRATLNIMQEQVRGFLEAEVHFISSFYSIAAMDGQTAEHLQRTICQYSRDEILTIMGWEEAASMFTGASIELKTCNAALLEATGKSWEEAFSVAGFGGWKLQGIVTPRLIITQTSICGKGNLHLLEGSTKDKIWRQLTNARGYMLRCSHYMPSPFPKETPLPCVIYCHGNSGCRADANEAAVILLPSNITVFTLDFSGSGLSDGDYVSLGWHERDDLKIVVSYLRSEKQISRIGLWGRSMGAVTSLLYGAEDPSIAGMVLDSAFSNLFDLMMELVDVYKIRLPKFTVKMAVQYMRRVIQKKAKFDIMDLNCLKGDKNVIKFDGDHNSSRPQFYYDSVSIFFYNVLHPPQISSTCSSKLEKYYDLGDLKVGAGMDESLLYEIITGLQSASTNAASSSSAPPSILTTKPVNELLSEVAPLSRLDSMLSGDNRPDSDEPSNLLDKPNGQSDECCSYTSSNRESWGRCSSLGGSDEESSADCTTADNSHQVTLNVLATPLKSMQQKSPDPSKEEIMKKRAPTIPKKPKREKFEKLEALSKRLRLCILKRVNHRRHRSP